MASSSTNPTEFLSSPNDEINKIEPNDIEKDHRNRSEESLETVAVIDIELDITTVNDEYINSKISCLEKMDQLCIKKGIKLGLSRTDVHIEIYDNQNRKIFLAKEQIEQLGCCYSPDRWLDMNVMNLHDEEILTLSRDKGTTCSWISCNLPTTEVFLSPKYKLGRIKGVLGIYPIKYNIEDEAGNCILKLRSGFSFPYLYFNILSSDKSSILGKISRDRPEAHHVFSRHYSVHLFFPDLPLKTKALLLGTALMIMSSHFEESE